LWSAIAQEIEGRLSERSSVILDDLSEVEKPAHHEEPSTPAAMGTMNPSIVGLPIRVA
jgi:hypothetical protein